MYIDFGISFTHFWDGVLGASSDWNNWKARIGLCFRNCIIGIKGLCMGSGNMFGNRNSWNQERQDIFVSTILKRRDCC